MTVWERVEADRLEKKEYEGFLKNDPDLAVKYGSDRDLFARNKAEAAASKAEYHVAVLDTSFPCKEDYAMEIEIKVPFGFDLRADLFFMKQLSVSRSRIKKWCEDGMMLNKGEALSPREKVKDGMLLQVRKEAFQSEQESEREGQGILSVRRDREVNCR